MTRKERPEEAERTGLVSRRTFLKGAAAGTTVLLVRPASLRLAEAASGGSTLEVEVVRPEDLLRLRFRLVNVVLDTGAPGTPVLLRKRPDRPALTVVEFPPQHVAERTLLLGEPQPPVSEGIAARIAGESRLAFVWPESLQSLPFSIEALLDWASLLPNLVPVARDFTARSRPRFRPPDRHETAIELPWFLVLSPGPRQAWAHATGPVTRDGVTELWHTRLASIVNGIVDESRPDGVRAVWASDRRFWRYLAGKTAPPGIAAQTAQPFKPVPGMPVRMPCTPEDRLNAVRATSDYSLYDPTRLPSGYLPTPFRTDRLMLTALGAWADLDGSWPDNPFNSLVAWRHRSTVGRDHYVRIVNRGYLYPFGHRCVLVRETERKLEQNSAQTRAAYLRTRNFLVITQPVRSYPGAFGLPDEGRRFPFRTVEVVTRVSPDFGPTISVGNQYALLPLALGGGDPIELTFRGTDWAGGTATFASPFVFVQDEQNVPFDAAAMTGIGAAYAALPQNQRSARLLGQTVAFAPSARPADTSLPVERLVWAAAAAAAAAGEAFKAADQMAAFPAMAEGVVRLADVEQIAGADGLGPTVQYPAEYIRHGFDAVRNAGEAFLALKSALPLANAAENAGGLVTPKTDLAAITRTFGPVGGKLQDVLADRFDPEQVFNDAAAKILGGIPLKEILALVDNAKTNAEKAIRYVRERVPDEVMVRFLWKPDLKADPARIFEPNPDGRRTTARFEGEARQGIRDRNKRSARFEGEITDFRLNLIGDGSTLFLRLDVARLAFKSVTGQKTQIDVAVNKITFDGALKFVEALRPFLEKLGKGAGTVRRPTEIVASMGFAIPSIGVAVFALSNLRFHASVTIPLTGQPVRVRLGFSSKDDPFTLTVMCFGGGGWFAIALGADGIEELNIGFTFAGQLALDVGVASGSISATAGIYLLLRETPPPSRLELEGFLKLLGQVQVLGIVAVSITLYLAFQYLRKGGPPVLEILTGRAKLTLSIQIFFFSISVSVDVEKSIGGNPADPTFAQAISASDWAEYAAAFAPVG